MGKRVEPDNLRVDTPHHEKYWHHDTFGPLNINAPKCKNKECGRRSFLNEYCPKHDKTFNESAKGGLG